MTKINMLKILGIPDDNTTKVLYNDGFFKDFVLFFDGNSSFVENIEFENINITTLYIGGDKQFKTVNLPSSQNVIINMICDPEIQKKSLAILETINFKAPVLNKPKDILKTARDTLSQNLQLDDRFVIPKTYRIKPESRKEIITKANEFFSGEEFLFRPVVSHGGMDLMKVTDYQEDLFDKYLINGETEYFITEFIDFKTKDNLYKKARFFVLDGEIYPRHLIISSDWKIHSNSRETLMNKELLTKQEEEEFLQNTPDIFKQFCKYIHSYLKLDFFGIDCSILPDGRVVLFEANVCMRPFAKHEDIYLQTVNTQLYNNFQNLLINKGIN